MNKYTVTLVVRGTFHRPTYEGAVTVFADDDAAAIDKAKRQLLRTSFFDAAWDDFKAVSVTRAL